MASFAGSQNGGTDSSSSFLPINTDHTPNATPFLPPAYTAPAETLPSAIPSSAPLLPLPSRSLPNLVGSSIRAPRKRNRTAKTRTETRAGTSTSSSFQPLPNLLFEDTTHVRFDPGIEDHDDFQSYQQYDDIGTWANEQEPENASAIIPPSVPPQLDCEVGTDVDLYSELIFNKKLAHLARIDRKCWAIESCANGLPQLGQFYHVTLYEGVVGTQLERMATCDCSKGKVGVRCAHQDVLLRNSERFKQEPVLSEDANPIAIEIASHLRGRRAWFSVLSTRTSINAQSQDGKRCIVSLIASQRWTCSASHCSGDPLPPSACVHRHRAQQFWQETLGVLGEEGNDDEDDEQEETDDLRELADNDESVQAHVQVRSCSHLPVPPPPFCRLPSDIAPRTPTPATSLPSLLPLGAHARCDCGAWSRPEERTRLRDCAIYFSTGCVARQIETQTCTCRKSRDKRSIGPDLSEYGFFNWNNAVIVSHELLNAFSSQMFASPTPFTAFCSTTQHAYEQHAPGTRQKFLARSTFVKLYFAYIQLQSLDVAFSCGKCGPSPSIIIADGVVLAYSSNLTHTRLRPPTTVGTDINTNARTQTIIPFLPNPALRAAAHAFSQSFDDGAAAERNGLLAAFSASLRPLLDTFAAPIALWARHFEQMLFALCLSAASDRRLTAPLHHLVRQFSANEGVLQLCRPLIGPTLIELASVCRSDTTTQRYSHLVNTLSRHCPFLGNAMSAFIGHSLRSSDLSLFTNMQLLLSATADVISHQLALLRPRQTPLPIPTQPQNDDAPYTQTGSLYGTPQLRTRPAYPHLDEGVGGKRSEKQAIHEHDETSGPQCRKFYDEYVKRKRTGGLMALWCPHRICVGFHVIPHAEGRNDVFSAIYTHWSTPPAVIVYDFACQLGPYSLRREPGFFKDTLFVVDQMHEKGHSNCSGASRLSTYMRTDPRLQHLYSSAAECGNAGLSRIKKTVSYSKQENAVALVKVFLSIWNRRRMREELAVKGA
ncbi:hypothetical protein CF336_g7582 [Tilletia laevis]|nr:hypothetical protein CF336_g7582 [Tilletia laevis]